jgi:hypothetical protein
MGAAGNCPRPMAVCALAVVAVFMPRSWMAVAHTAIGLGQFPAAPIAEYLARSLSAFYALTGALMWLMSHDPGRYSRLIWYVGLLGIIGAPLLFIMDTRLNMPPSWRLSEGPMVLLISAILLVLLQQYEKSPRP